MCYALWLAVVSLLVAPTCGRDSLLFNFEVGHRALDNVRLALEQPKIAASQISAAFRIGMIQEDDADMVTQLRNLIFSQYLNSPDWVQYIIAAFDSPGTSLGFIRSDGLVFAPNSTWCYMSNVSTPCVSYFAYDSTGAPTNHISSTSLDYRTHDWYQTASSGLGAWTDVYLSVVGSPAVAYASPLLNSTNHFVGVVSVAMLTSSIDTFLFESFHDSLDERVVFIVDSQGLVSASVVGVTTKVVNGEPVRVRAEDCSHPIIRRAGAFLVSSPYVYGLEQSFHLFDNLYIQTHTLSTLGVNWTVVVVRPAVWLKDYIVEGSASYVGLSVAASCTVLVSIATAAWVIRFRHMKLWRAGQPVGLVVVLFSHVLCACSVFVVIGKPSDARCLLKQWWLSLAVTVACAALVAKIWRVLVILGYKTKKANPVSAWAPVIRVAGVVGVQIVILIVWSAFDPLHSATRTLNAEDVPQLSLVCKTHGVWGEVLVIIVLAAVLITGFRMAYLSRFMSTAFAESKVVVLTFYHAVLLIGLVGGLALFGSVSAVTVDTFTCMVLIWFVLTTQGALFVPRLQRQLILGDFTQDEAKEHIRHHLAHKNAESSNPKKTVSLSGQPPTISPPASGNVL